MFSLVGNLFYESKICVSTGGKYVFTTRKIIFTDKNMFLPVAIMFPLVRKITLQAKLFVFFSGKYVSTNEETFSR